LSPAPTEVGEMDRAVLDRHFRTAMHTVILSEAERSRKPALSEAQPSRMGIGSEGPTVYTRCLDRLGTTVEKAGREA
jgi:hypothetical protein